MQHKLSSASLEVNRFFDLTGASRLVGERAERPEEGESRASVARGFERLALD
jgi:hypothetical protein